MVIPCKSAANFALQYFCSFMIFYGEWVPMEDSKVVMFKTSEEKTY